MHTAKWLQTLSLPRINWTELHTFLELDWSFQAETFLSAEKKNNSISGEAKNVTGDLFDEQLGITSALLFFGAGGHVSTSGILNLLAFGVAQTLEQTPSLPSSSTFVKPCSWELEEAVACSHGLVIDLCCFVSSSFCHLIWVVVIEDGAISGSATAKSYFLWFQPKPSVVYRECEKPWIDDHSAENT